MEVKKRRGRPVKDTEKLEKNKIIQTAQDMILADGKVPSIRYLASELNVDPMAIYYYFSNKQILLEAVSISLISELYKPRQDLSWKENLLQLCRSYILLLLKYPDLISIILSTSGKGTALIFLQRFESCVEELNLNPEKINTITALLADYIHGFSFASACNKTDMIVTVDMAEKPLTFIIDNISD